MAKQSDNTPDRLTIEELRELTSDLTGAQEYTLRDKEYARRRDLTHGRSSVEIPGINIPPAAQWHSPEINTDAHLYVRRITNAKLTIHATALAEGRRAEQKASRIKDYLTYLYTDWRTRGLFQPALFDTAVVGTGVLHPLIRPEALPDLPSRNDDERPTAYFERIKQSLKSYKGCPFDLETIDANTLYSEADGSVMLQKAIVPVRAINRIYRARGKMIGVEDGKVHIRELSGAQGWNEAAEARRGDTVELISAEDANWCYRLVSGISGYGDAELLDVYPNYAEEPSYVQVLGDLTGERDALNFSQPWLLGKFSTVPLKNLFGTVLIASGIRSGQQRYKLVWKGDPNQIPANVGVQDIRVVDGVIDIPPGFDLEMPKIELGVDAIEALRYIEQSDTYGFPRELAAPMEFDAKSGADRGKAMDAMSNIMDSPLERWAEALGKTFKIVLHMQRKLELDLNVTSARTSLRQPDNPVRVMDEIEVPYSDLEDADVALEFKSISQQTEIMGREEDLKLRSEGMLTDTEFQRNRGVEDTQAWFRLKGRDEMRVFMRTMALEDAKKAVENIRAAVLAKAAARAKLDPALADAAGTDPGGSLPLPAPTDGITSGITPSVPTSPGTAMPINPPEGQPLPSYESGGVVA